VREDIDQRVFGKGEILRTEVTYIRHAVSLEQPNRMLCETRMKRVEAAGKCCVGPEFEHSIG
jgi:hypothetical protein